ncbi:MAG: hypothetical protein JJ992_16665, partial [Planctomycetes bacterium]|nr:hypothetical protein [Planctomycetota bacterium]
RAGSGCRRIVTKPPAAMSDGRVPRISKLMALAIRFEGLIRDGQVADQSELARLARVTQPRMTQIMNLLHLAPDIQEALLLLPRVELGRAPIHEELFRPIAAETDADTWERRGTTASAIPAVDFLMPVAMVGSARSPSCHRCPWRRQCCKANEPP